MRSGRVGAVVGATMEVRQGQFGAVQRALMVTCKWKLWRVSWGTRAMRMRRGGGRKRQQEARFSNLAFNRRKG